MTEYQTQFENRFRSVVQQMRITRVLTILGWVTFILTLVIVTLSCIDYFAETTWNLRAAVVGVASIMGLVVGCYCVLRTLQKWNRVSTAAQVERRFDDLGQSVRTAVQFRDRNAATDGVSVNLLNALHEDVHQKTEDLRLTEAVRKGSLKVSVVCLALAMALVAAACISSWDWRMAFSRALLGNRPYTTVHVEQGDTRVDEKATFNLVANVSGRIDRDTKLLTRPYGEDSTWNTQSLDDSDAVMTEARLVSYSVDVPKVKEPFEYQVVSGKYSSPVYKVDVRFPLAIQSFHVQVSSPAYTGLETKHLHRGSFEAVEGSEAVIEIELDHEPDTAWLEMRPVFTPLGEEPIVEKIDFRIVGPNLSATLSLHEDRFYEIHASTNEGTKLRPNRQRIRVREDLPPRVVFETPSQLTEVHPLAEIMMRLKVSDDFGLRRAGIVFQRNNEAEFPLAEVEYDDIELEDGRLTPQTKARIESLFPLEYFDLTVNDSISYYGFAEDNRPGEFNRNETDLHFIDVRPFRRLFAQPNPAGLNGMGNGDNPNRRNLPALNDMIARERFVLNRTMQMDRGSARGKEADINAVDNLIKIQNEGSDLTFQMGQVAEEIEGRFGVPEEGRISPLLFEARNHMLSSIDSLANVDFDVAELQEKEALQNLINARQRLDEPVRRGRNGGGGQARMALRAAFRRLNRARNRNKPKNDRQRARMIVQRLRQAANQQEFLMEKMSDLVAPELPEMEEEEMPAEDSPEQEPPEPESPVDEPQENQDDVKDDDADDVETDEQDTPDELKQELENEQQRLADDVQDIVEMIEELQQLSDLASQRSGSAMSGPNGILSNLQRGNATDAVENARDSVIQLRVLADNIAGVTADEASKRLEVARDLSMLLTDEMYDLEGDIARASRSMENSDAEGSELAKLKGVWTTSLTVSADEQGEIAKTIQDILGSIIDPEQGIQDPDDIMVKRIQEIMEENEIETNVGRLQQLSSSMETMQWPSLEAETNDLAVRFEIVSQRLDAMHRELLSPRLEQLRRLEKRVLNASDELTELQTNDQVNRWHFRTEGLMEDIESAKVAEAESQVMREQMKSAGWGSRGDWDWDSNDSGTGLVAPEAYPKAMGVVLSEIQRQIRELSVLNSDIRNTGAIPPQYKLFVDRYIEVLSGVKTDNMNGAEK